MAAVDPSAMAEELKAIITALEDIQISRYVGATGVVVLLYDHLLTLPDEIEFVWPAKNTGPKILFLLFRYMVPFFILINTSRPAQRVIAYNDVHRVASPSSWLSQKLLLRIYTLIPRRHKLVAWTFCFWVVVQVTSLAVATWTVVGMIPLIFSSNGSCAFTARPNVSGLWVVGLAFEVVRSLRYYTQVLFALRLANTVIAVVAPLPLLFVGVLYVHFPLAMPLKLLNQHVRSFIWAAATLTTSRLIINSRKTARLAILEAEANWDDWKEFDSP
ncbi:hypothetical protein C8F04DRAFT_1256165 [Mycena alexandri]|uniref:DUF6533 domain-containing protein n=1 Tax=Mycena alexandri TaxID=1745969 RepID=A0AAD6X3Y7_9AGAR|nr:hypothetical protein C8F04DRAFT_1256165 [Mycena alexandri]